MLQILNRKITILFLLINLQLLRHRNEEYISINYAKREFLGKTISIPPGLLRLLMHF